MSGSDEIAAALTAAAERLGLREGRTRDDARPKGVAG
jgi:hypothetical protein